MKFIYWHLFLIYMVTYMATIYHLEHKIIRYFYQYKLSAHLLLGCIYSWFFTVTFFSIRGRRLTCAHLLLGCIYSLFFTITFFSIFIDKYVIKWYCLFTKMRMFKNISSNLTFNLSIFGWKGCLASFLPMSDINNTNEFPIWDE